jgi:hypothetical protein
MIVVCRESFSIFNQKVERNEICLSIDKCYQSQTFLVCQYLTILHQLNKLIVYLWKIASANHLVSSTSS